MRTIIIIFLVIALPTILLAQQTYVPDDNFEWVLIDWGYDTPPLNDSVPTANIETVTELYIGYKQISDLTGVEDFKALQFLDCSANGLTSLNVSNNTDLQRLECFKNNLTSFDVSNNPALEILYCSENNLASLDLSNNTALEKLYCQENKLANLDLSNNVALGWLNCSENNLTILNLNINSDLYWLNCSENNLTSLNVSNNPVLRELNCYENNLTSLNIKNGNNKYMTGSGSKDYFDASGNPDLYCIQVDDSAWSAKEIKWAKDDHAHYSEDCGYTGIDFRAEDETDNISISSSPNPFSQSTMINFQLSKSGRVVLNVYDVFGNEVATLLNEFKDAGKHKAQFNAGNLPQGIYFYKIQIDNATRSGKLLLIK